MEVLRWSAWGAFFRRFAAEFLRSGFTLNRRDLFRTHTFGAAPEGENRILTHCGIAEAMS